MAILGFLPPAYFAGIVDGEGTFTLTRLHASENRRVVLSVSSTELRLLEHLVRATAVGHITTKKTVSWRHARSYAWSVRGRQALDLIAQIEPYLQTYKVQRARLLLTDYVRLTPRKT